MKYHLVDPSYCATVDLTYHKHAIREGIRAISKEATINIHRHYFEVEAADLEDGIDLLRLCEEISNRDQTLNKFVKHYEHKKGTTESTVTPLLFKIKLH
ncbi:MAG TPA: hypothetical protein DCY20_06890 [Firmicutes bacterium]|nr:hypothetical protein [Bacillota bacterium]